MKAVSFLLVLALPLCAQSGPMKTWLPDDPTTAGIVKIEIQGTTVHVFGNCSPTACDWGLVTADIYARSVDAPSTSPAAYQAHYSKRYADTDLSMSIEDDGSLLVQTFTHFKDHSRRKDYFTIQHLHLSD